MADEEILKSLEDIRNYGRDYIRENPESGFLTGSATPALRGMPASTAGMLPDYMNLLLHKEGRQDLGRIGDTRLSDQDIRGISEVTEQFRTPDETISEMMIEERRPMPDEFGRMTPVPSSDEEAVKQDFRRVLADGTVGELRQYIEMNIGDLKLLAQTDNSIAKDLEAALRSIATGDQSRFQGLSPDQNLRTWDEAFQADQNIAQKTYQSPPASGAAFASPGGWDPYAYLEKPEYSPYGERTPDVLPREEFQPFQTEFAHGGYVDRGTMAGELGRRGDLSVREAGETMYERNKRLHGYDRGGYVHDRGTMPGELHPKGSLSVRVAGESMGEYEKHREDEDDYRPVRRTLATALSPTLSRRMFG